MSNFIRVLRNTELCATREAAIEKLQGKLATLQDGEICIASYGDNSDWSTAKTVLGVVRLKDGKRSYTIFDNEDIAGIAAKIKELDATVRGNLSDTDVVETGKHVGVKVVEEDGKLTGVTVVESDIASAAELGTKNDAAGTDTAFGRIAQEVADRTTAITNAIAALDSSVAATVKDGEQYSVLTGVTQTDGKLTGVAEVKLAAVAKTGLASDVAKAVIPNDGTYATVEGENVSEQIASIAKTIKGISDTQANPVKYKTVKLSDTEVSALGANVKEAYQVVSYTGTWESATDKATVGETIKIYKDANVKEIYLGSSKDKISSDGTITKVPEKDIVEAELSLNYAYVKADGTYEMASIPVGSFLRESEFKNGLQVAGNGEVSVKVADGSETFLTVDGNGVKLSGVQTAIDNAIDGLTTTKSGTDGKVTVEVAQTEGLITGVTVTTPGLASEAEVVKSVTVNEVTSTFANNNASLTIKGGNIEVAGTYTATVYPEQFEAKVGANNHIKAADKIDAALKKAENTISVLATEVISNEKVTTAAVSKLAESAGVAGADGVIKYTPKQNANYIGAATSVHDATVKLDDAIKAVANTADNALTSVVGSNAIEVSTKASHSQTVSLKLDGAADNALAVNANGLYLSNVWDCGTY